MSDEEARKPEETEQPQEEKPAEPEKEASAEEAPSAEEKPAEEQMDATEKATLEAKKEKDRQAKLGWILGLIIIVAALALIPVVHLSSGQPWDSNEMLATYIVSGIVIATVLGVAITLKVTRTRYSVERDILEFREVTEYIIIWNRPRWVLYLPTAALAVLFGIFVMLYNAGMFPKSLPPHTFGGIWVGLAFLNVMVEQFHMSIKTVFIVIPTVGALLLLLHLVGYADNALRLLRYLAMDLPAKFYFMAAFVIGVVVFMGWVHGLFHYMAITPNVADMQRGLTETGRQIKNADYEVDFDATDVVERWLFGFGRIVISFNDPNRPPMTFFVPHASEVDDRIRRVRSVTAIDRRGDDAF